MMEPEQVIQGCLFGIIEDGLEFRTVLTDVVAAISCPAAGAVVVRIPVAPRHADAAAGFLDQGRAGEWFVVDFFAHGSVSTAAISSRQAP